MMFADVEGVDAGLLGDDGFFDDVAQDLGLGFRLAAGADGDVAERIETKFKGKARRAHPYHFTRRYG